jgi:hypothetical protein
MKGLLMHQAISRWLFTLCALCAPLLFVSCELATNPLLFDGSPLSANFRANTNGTFFADSMSLDLSSVISGINIDIDSVSVINISLLIDSLNGGTLGSTTITGAASFDGDTLVTLTNVPLSTFSSERSIFDPALISAGVRYGAAGVSHINNLLKHPESLPSSITVGVIGRASQSGLHFSTHIKFYTQVFTHP